MRAARGREGTEEAVLNEAVFEEGLPIHSAHDVEVEGVPGSRKERGFGFNMAYGGSRNPSSFVVTLAIPVYLTPKP